MLLHGSAESVISDGEEVVPAPENGEWEGKKNQSQNKLNAGNGSSAGVEIVDSPAAEKKSQQKIGPELSSGFRRAFVSEVDKNLSAVRTDRLRSAPFPTVRAPLQILDSFAIGCRELKNCSTSLAGKKSTTQIRIEIIDFSAVSAFDPHKRSLCFLCPG